VEVGRRSAVEEWRRSAVDVRRSAVEE